ncbi:hypothetical protein JD844_031281 [Phrynosoma platyrhinos]|uniref:CTNNB1 binding N-teminal domain-containing protein n=1 Tax=Phrynosoma platyrhinos TaxID=52577 RepID=A0ABQ7T0G0_PHRPL|nr:hypothetical protein JD844_031281 [Phrynosoma platyrhinos]
MESENASYDLFRAALALFSSGILKASLPSLAYIEDETSADMGSNKVPVVQHAHHMHPLTPLITYSNDHFSPGSPPSHLSPEIDPKTGEFL